MRSVFEIIGPIMVGPSSSHTAGMARIGAEAFRRLPAGEKEIHLTFSKKMEKTYGGHRSDSAALGGALGLTPDSPKLRAAYDLAAEQGISVRIDFFEESAVPENTLRVTFLYENGKHRSLTASSVGGGSIEILALDDKPVRLLPYCDFGETLPDANPLLPLPELLRIAREEQIPLWEQALRYEIQRSGNPRESIRARMESHWQAMKESVIRGQGQNAMLYGLTPGDDGKRLLAFAKEGKSVSGGLLPIATGYALGVLEQNASMGRVVAAPTAGSAGILPGILLAAGEQHPVPEEKQIRSLFTAALFGICMDEKGISFSGSVGGCQGEIGVSSALAAAALASLFTDDGDVIAHAMALSLKNLLGLVCDPIAGPIEVPCIKRNAVGVANACIACDMALSGIRSFIPPEEVMDALLDVEKRMPTELRCAAIGGLACSKTACEYRKRGQCGNEKAEPINEI